MPAVTPELITLILVLIAAEAVLLWLLMRRLGLGRFVPAVMAFLLSGAFLMEALRGTLGATATLPLPVLLLGSLVGHLASLGLAYWALREPR